MFFLTAILPAVRLHGGRMTWDEWTLVALGVIFLGAVISMLLHARSFEPLRDDDE